MKNQEVKYYFIDETSDYYLKAVELRYRIFYAPTNTSMDAIYDEFEKDSEHLIAVKDGKLIGYMRLTVKADTAYLTQFVTDESVRGIISIPATLVTMLEKLAREKGASKILGEIRLPVAKAAKKFGFTVSDEIFASKKTGIPHKRIYKELK